MVYSTIGSLSQVISARSHLSECVQICGRFCRWSSPQRQTAFNRLRQAGRNSLNEKTQFFRRECCFLFFQKTDFYADSRVYSQGLFGGIVPKKGHDGFLSLLARERKVTRDRPILHLQDSERAQLRGARDIARSFAASAHMIRALTRWHRACSRSPLGTAFPPEIKSGDGSIQYKAASQILLLGERESNRAPCNSLDKRTLGSRE